MGMYQGLKRLIGQVYLVLLSFSFFAALYMAVIGLFKF